MVNYLSVLIISFIDVASPASPCISDGIIIFVALPSAAFSKLSSALSAIYGSPGFDSFILRIPSATAVCTVMIASASPSASFMAACFLASALRIADSFSPSARRIADFFSPSARRMLSRLSFRLHLTLHSVLNFLRRHNVLKLNSVYLYTPRVCRFIKN